MLRYVPVIPDFSKAFIMKGCWILSKAFSASSEMIMLFFLSRSVHMVDYIDGFSYVEPSLQPWDEANLLVVDDFSDVFLDLICQYFIEYFCNNVHEGYWSVVLFLSCVFMWLGYQGY